VPFAYCRKAVSICARVKGVPIRVCRIMRDLPFTFVNALATPSDRSFQAYSTIHSSIKNASHESSFIVYLLYSTLHVRASRPRIVSPTRRQTAERSGTN